MAEGLEVAVGEVEAALVLLCSRLRMWLWV